MKTPTSSIALWLRALALLGALAGLPGASALAQNQGAGDYPLSAGDTIRIQVFQNPDLTLETRVSESGGITYPLIGAVDLNGTPLAMAEKRIANALKSGGFLRDPQVSITLLQVRGNQVSVLGQVNRPGRYPLETTNLRLSDVLAMAGGTTGIGDDVAILAGTRNGKPFRQTVDVAQIYLSSRPQDDLALQGGDTVYVHRAPVFYIYGEAQRPGAYRIERGMSVMQALALGGGPTARGTDKRLRLHRTATDGSVQMLEPQLSDLVQPQDVIYVRESLF